MLFYIIMAVSLLAIGGMVHGLKWHFLISGYNTMSSEKKARVDIEKIARLMGIWSYINGGVFLFMAFLSWRQVEVSMLPAMGFLVITLILMLIRAQKYDGNLYEEDGRWKKSSKVQMALVLGGISLVVLFVGGMLYTSMQPVTAVMEGDQLTIRGMYGASYAYEDITEVKLLDTLPTITMRTNGSAVESHLRGYFNTRELGKIKLFVDTKLPPFIQFTRGNTTVIFNLKDAKTTTAFYESLEEAIKNSEP